MMGILWARGFLLVLLALLLQPWRLHGAEGPQGPLLPLPNAQCEQGQPLVVVPLLDGSIHGLELNSGRLCWSFASGPPLLTSTARQVAAVGGTWQTNGNGSSDMERGMEFEVEEEDEEDEEEGWEGAVGEKKAQKREREKEVVFPSADGSLYAYQPGHGVQKLPVTARELVAASPSVTRDGGIVLGARRSTVYMLDVHSGKVIRRMDAQAEPPEHVASSTQEVFAGQFLGTLNWDPQAVEGLDSMADALLVMRTDYIVRAVDMGSGAQRWNVSVGELGTLDNPMAVSSLPYHSTLEKFGKIVAGDDNSLRYLDPESSEDCWRVAFPAAPTAVFSSSGVLLQRLLPEKSLDDLVYLTHMDGHPYALPASHGSARGSDKLGKITRPDAPQLMPGSQKKFKTVESLKGLRSLEGAASRELLVVAAEGRAKGSQIYGDLACAAPNSLVLNREEEEQAFQTTFVSSSSSNAGDFAPLSPLPQPPAPPPLPPPAPLRASVWLSLAAAFVGAGVVVGAFLMLREKRPVQEEREERRQKELKLTPSKRKKLRKLSAAAASAPAISGMTSESESAGTSSSTNLVRNRGQDKKEAAVAKGEKLPPLGDGRWVGRLLVGSTVIGYGSHGTLVLEGQLEGRPVAVKRLLVQFYEKARKEIAALIASDEHPNVVRCFAMEEDSAFVYVALERCCMSLGELILACSPRLDQDALAMESCDEIAENGLEQAAGKLGRAGSELVLWDGKGRPTPLLLQLMRDMVAGMAHVHQLGIVHRDLKPQNVLVCTVRGPAGTSLLRAKLSDMGISKRLTDGASSFDPHTSAAGSAGWQAPEVLQGGAARQTRAVDLFALGCVLFFCAAAGRHPFGPRLHRDANIVRGAADLFPLDHLPEAPHLLRPLLSPDPARRLTAAEVERHPLLWSSEQRLAFLRDASDRMEGEDREEGSELLAAMEAGGPAALGGAWLDRLDPLLLENLGRYRRYNYRSVRDLLRVIRNKSNHYRELPQGLQELLGPMPEGYETYFRDRFPSLLIHVYDVLKKFCLHDPIFRRYFFQSASSL